MAYGGVKGLDYMTFSGWLQFSFCPSLVPVQASSIFVHFCKGS